MNANQKFTIIFLLTIGIIIVNNQLSHKKEITNKVTDLARKKDEENVRRKTIIF